MAVGNFKSTLPGGLTPVCNSCSCMEPWDISIEDYESKKAEWDRYECADCRENTNASVALTPQSIADNIHLIVNDRSQLSAFYSASFEVKGVKFATLVQFLMYCKAKLNGHDSHAKSILGCRSAVDCIRAASLMPTCNEAIWKEKLPVYLLVALKAKHTQDKQFAEALRSTDGKEIISVVSQEASIGLAVKLDDLYRLSEADRNKQNLLGVSLMQLRAQIGL